MRGKAAVVNFVVLYVGDHPRLCGEKLILDMVG